MEDLPVPLSRVELYLAKAAGMDVTVPEAPESRLEQFLAIIAGDTTVEMPTPLSLTEMWLAYVIGVTPDPLLPVEGACYIGNQKVDVRYFAVAAGMPGAVLPPAPQNRKEQYWALIQGGGGGVLKYATGTNIALTDVVRGIDELQFIYGDTYQQTYSGKNKFVTQNITYTQEGITCVLNGSELTASGKKTSGIDYIFIGNALELETDLPAGTYTMSIKAPQNLGIGCNLYYKENSGVIGFRIPAGSTSHTIVSDYHINKIRVLVYGLETGETYDAHFEDIQIELSATPTSYEPYVGGIPAPNPDYPQAVQTVTGEQAVTVSDGTNTQNFTVDLGSIELCKIGTYQDYIYKSGDDWYVHKETKKIILDGTEDNWDYSTTYSTFWLYNITDIITTSTREKFTYSNNFSQGLSTTAVAQWASMPNNSVAIRGSSTMVGFKTDIADSTTAWKTWLDSHNTILYYPLATPTDTKITDATLVGQLNAIDSAVLPKPIAYITVGATDPNLPGPLKISYYGEEE